MSTVKILSSDGLTEIAEQQISEARNLFFESPTAPSLNSISATPTNVFVDDAADDAILWSDGVETPLTMSVSEASNQGTQTTALSLPESVISKKLTFRLMYPFAFLFISKNRNFILQKAITINMPLPKI